MAYAIVLVRGARIRLITKWLCQGFTSRAFVAVKAWHMTFTETENQVEASDTKALKKKGKNLDGFEGRIRNDARGKW
jgi:hypothetical protein